MANEFVARKGLISSGSVVVSGSLTASFFKGDGSQLTNVIPANVVSSSTQVTALLPTGTVSSSGQVSYTGLSGVPSGIISSSTQLPSGTVSSSAQVSYTGLSNIPSSIVSSSAQVTSLLPTGTVSASSQVDVRNTTGIATLATTGSNNFKGTQTVTGSLYTSGSNTLIGNTVLSGSLIVSGTVGTSTPNIQIYGDTDINGYLQFNPVSTNINTSISASYIYVSGSTQDLYFSQNGNGYNNVTRLRWLESNLYTGILNGGILSSTPGSTTFNISAGEGIIVALNASTTQDPYPVIQRVTWSTQSNIPIKYSGSAKITYVGLDNTGSPVQQTNSWGSSDITQWDTQIQLGVVLHLSGSVSTGVFNSPQISYGTPQKVDDFTRAFGPLKISGHTLQASGSTLGLVKTSGNSYREGANYTVNPSHPSTVVESAITTSKVFRYYLSGSTPIIDTGVANAGYTVIDPTKYVNTTTGTLTNVSANRWSIQRVFWVPNSPTNAFIVYYGNGQYLSLLDANAAIATEPFTEAPNTAQNAILVGYIIARRDCTNLTDTTTSAIIQAGLFRSVAGIGASTSAAITAQLTDLSDVAITSVSTGDMLVYGADGSTQWVNSKQLSGNYGITGSLNVNGTISGSLTLPSGIVSSSTQVTSLLPTGTVSSSGQVSYAGLTNIPSGIVSSSTQVATLLPAGTVSSSTQATTWTVATASYATTASYALSNAGTVTTAQTASYSTYAVTASYASNGGGSVPAGTVSSSAQTIANISASAIEPSTVNNLTVLGRNGTTAVGIGATYHMSGANDSNTYYGGVTAVGYQALYNNSDGYANTAVGKYALTSNTTAWENTAVGDKALYSNTGNGNTAIGAAAMFANTTGTYSVAVGDLALNIGSDNTSVAIGASALQNATGSSNTAVGYQAGQNATNGTINATFLGVQAATTAVNSSYSTFIGYQVGNGGGSNTSAIMLGRQAGLNAVSGSDSIFIGREAGNTQNNSNASISIGYLAGFQANNSVQSVYIGTNTGYQATDNTGVLAIGSNSGYQATGSNNSVWIGGYAGYQSSNSPNGVYIGPAAGYGLKNATANVLIGNIAGTVAGVGKQIGSLNVIIGNQISLPTASSNTMNLGAIIFATNIYGNTSLLSYDLITGSKYEAGFGSGNVGINTSAPTHNLHVVGNGRFTTGLTVSGSLISCGNNNIATNTALGVSALNANTTGTSNVAIGYQSLNANQGGTNNIAIGTNALYTNTGASSNIAIGYGALLVSTGQNNVAVGDSALNSNGSTSYNTAVGYQALYSETAGSSNTAIGWSAMSGASAGSNNTALGTSALNGVSGSNNVGVGHSAGSSLTAGANNIIIGQNAQASSTTVDNEITLGNSNITKFRVPALNWNVTSTQHTISGSFAVSGSGTFTGNVTAQSLTETSTIRMKENVQPIESTLQTVQLLQPVRFDWKASKVADIGLIAEHVNEIYPEFVDRDINGNPLGIHYSKLTVVLIKAIQELTARLDKLEGK